jgi:hypothetical protein
MRAPFSIAVVLAASALSACLGLSSNELILEAPAIPPLPGAPASCVSAGSPGRVEPRRLNREELAIGWAQLLQLPALDASALPAEPTSADGFDNNAGILPMSTELVEALLDLSEKAVASALARPGQTVFQCAAGNPACHREALSRFARAAFRRPATESELQRLEAVRSASGVGAALQAALLSPQSFYQLISPSQAGKVHNLSDFELASRLAMFLWSRPPDDELLALAGQGELSKPEVLAAQARRMIADARSASFGESFSSQWLSTRLLFAGTVKPDPAVFGNQFNEGVRAAMSEETRALFQHLLRADKSPLELLDANYTFVNGPLAQLYGLPGVSGDQLQQISLSGTQRRGVLTHGSFLTFTSSPQRTSPTRRGHWVLSHLTCNAPPDPPPGIEPLPTEGPNAPKTVRERMEVHRSKAGCQGCHVAMDPIGLGFEHFDGIGRYRTQDGATAIDASGDLPGSGKFATHLELVKLLRESQPLRTCVSKKLLSYALGRSVTLADSCTVEHLAQRAGERFSDLLVEIVLSAPFRQQVGELP